MKAHEETDWTHSDLYEWFDRTKAKTDPGRDNDAIKARGRLASYAPDMARLLLKIAGLRDAEDARDVAEAICVDWADDIKRVLENAGVRDD